MRIPYTHESIRLTGRWDTTSSEVAVTTATGSYIELAFTGKTATLRFDVTGNANPPLLHLWIELDGIRIEAPIDYYLRVSAADDGAHILRVIFKGTIETKQRWCAPLESKVSFLGADVEAPAPLPADERPIIEFVGDSITEGVLIDADFAGDDLPPYEKAQYCRAFQDDACATYAWLTAEALDLRPVMMGYGAVGVTRGGNGSVPMAQDAYPYNFEGSPVTRQAPAVIVINHGANDRSKPAEEYVTGYRRLLDTVIAMNPKALVVCLSAFCGGHHETLGELVAAYNAEHGTSVRFIDSFGWIPEEPLHPLRDGHITVAEHLAPLLREMMK